MNIETDPTSLPDPVAEGGDPLSRKKYLLLFVAGGLGAIFLFIITTYLINQQAVARHERMFQEQQSLQVFLGKQAIEDRIHRLFLEGGILSGHSLPEFAEGRRDLASIRELFSSEQNAYPENLAYVYMTSPAQVIHARDNGTPKGQKARQLAVQWTQHHWDTLADKKSGPVFPPFHITETSQMFAMLFPVRVAREMRGVLAVVTDLSPMMMRYVAPMRSGAYGAGYLLDGQGRIVYDHETEIIGRSVFDGMHDSYPQLMQVDRRLITEPLGTDEYSFTVKRDGRVFRKLIAWNTARVGDQKLVVCLSAPDIEIDAALFGLRLQRMLSGALLALVLLAMSAIFFRSRQRMMEQTAALLRARVQQRTDALNESEERFRLAFHTSPDAISISKTDGTFIEVNQGLISLTGYAREDIIGKSSLTIGLWEDPKHRERFVDIIQKKGMVENFESKFRSRKGQIIATLISANLIRLKDEPHILSIIRDITALKEAEAELRRLRNLLSNIINSMPSVLIGVNAEGMVTHWNLEASRITEIPPDKAQGCELAEVFPQLAGEMEKVREAIRERTPRKNEKVPRQQNGETFFSDVTVYPLITNGAEGAVIRVDDVTARVRMEEVMIQTEKMYSVGGLAAGMAHEINNPLACILQNSQVVLDRLTSDLPVNHRTAADCGTRMDAIRAFMEKRDIVKMLRTVMASGERAAQVVSNMLSFSRKSDSRMLPHDLRTVTDNTLDLAVNDYDLRRKYDFRKIEIIREYDPDIPALPCDEVKLRQVILNLLRNSAQAMSEAGTESPRIILRIFQHEGMGHIEVEDNGPGMPETVRKRVFEPFFTTKDVGLGAGLGLFVSYFIIRENHGGSMTVASEPGKGSKFIIRLPIRLESN